MFHRKDKGRGSHERRRERLLNALFPTRTRGSPQGNHSSNSILVRTYSITLNYPLIKQTLTSDTYRSIQVQSDDQDPDDRTSQLNIHIKGDGGRVSSETEGTHSASRPSDDAINALSHDAGLHESKDTSLGPSLWIEAYKTLETNPEYSEILENFKICFREDTDAELDGADEIGKDTQQLQSIQQLAKKKLEKFTESQFTFSIRGRRIVARELLRKAVNVISRFRDAVSSAISAEPHAAMAWLGIMIILPLVENAYQQDEDAVNGLNEILFLLIRYQEMQEGFLSFEFQSSRRSNGLGELLLSIRSQVISVYADVYLYEARFLLQFKRSKLHRLARNIVAADDWKQRWQTIETKVRRIDQAVQSRLTTRTLEIWKKVDDVKKMTTDLLSAVQELKDEHYLSSLYYAEHAPFDSAAVLNSANPCLRGTQRRILNDIRDWVEDPEGELIFWLRGMAGTGKTSVALTVAEALSNGEPFTDEGRPPRNAFFGASFFFQQGDTTRNSTRNLFPTIARYLAATLPDLKPYIIYSIKEHLGIESKSAQQQLDHLIIKPLLMLGKQMFPSTRLVVIIDALDECEQADELLGMMATLASLSQVQLRILITSRGDDHILRSFKNRLGGLHRAIPLGKIKVKLEDEEINDDITFYLTKRLAEIAKTYGVPQNCIDAADIKRLSEKADGLFIYAATACRFLESPNFRNSEFRRVCLDLIFDDDMESTPLQKVDEIYMKALSLRKIADGPKKYAQKLFIRIAKVLGFITIFFVPVSVSTLTKLLGFEAEMVDDALGRLHSVVNVPQDRNSSLGLVHLSFRDFLLNEERSKGMPFQIKEMPLHQAVFESCLKLMSDDLHQDMCRLTLPGSLTSEVSLSQLEVYVPQYLRYACRYWVHHLAKLDKIRQEEVGLMDNGKIHEFLSKNFLYWLETMGLIGEASNAVLIVDHLKTLIDPVKHPKLSSFVYDARRFVLMNKWVIEQAPLQIYCSALLFSPTTSIIRISFEMLIPSWITQKPKMQKDWTIELSVFEGHTEEITFVAFSPTDDLLLSLSDDRTAIIRDYVTGTERFKFDDIPIRCCSFSPDGKVIAFGTYDGSIYVRELATGREVGRLLGHKGFVASVVFSPKSNNTLATNTSNTIRIWDIDKRLAVHKFKTHSGHGHAITFTPDGELLAGPWKEGSIGIWNVESGELVKTLEYDSNFYTSIAIAMDSKTLATGSIGGELGMWNITSGNSLRDMIYKSTSVQVAFVPQDERLIAIACGNGVVEFRHVDTWDLVRKFGTEVVDSYNIFGDMSLSRDGKMLAIASGDRTVKLWDLTSETSEVEDEVCTNLVEHIELLPTDDKVICALARPNIELWDLDSGSVKLRLGNVRDRPIFSQDGRFAALDISNEYRIRPATELWNGNLEEKIVDIPGYRDAIFSPDGNCLALSGASCIHILECMNPNRSAMIEIPMHSHLPTLTGEVCKFTPHEQFLCIVRWWQADFIIHRTFHLWDMLKKEDLFSYQCFGSAKEVVFSPNGELVTFPGKEGIVLLELPTGQERRVFKVETGQVDIKFHSEGNLIAIRNLRCDISIWQTTSESEEPLFTTSCLYLNDKEQNVTGMAISTTGTLAITSRQQTRDVPNYSTIIRLWNIFTGVEMGQLQFQVDAIHSLSFTADSLYLESSIGKIPIPPVDEDGVLKDVSEAAQDSLFVETQWIVQGFEKLLWLPPAYRVRSVAFKEEKVIIGARSGSVKILGFDLATTPLSSRLKNVVS
ncbi:hypothetical protein F4805DRAFT_152247 [Annulohypoxylon moriforme]|nr:hypothetical protein F4805DRAFT_152247 [Annulohypoxylon moriforme]